MIALEILDAAEQFGCDSIVLPLRHAKLARPLRRDVVRDLIGQAWSVSVCVVDAKGTEMPGDGRLA